MSDHDGSGFVNTVDFALKSLDRAIVEIDQLQSRLDAAEKERDEALDYLRQIAHIGASSISRDYMRAPSIAEKGLNKLPSSYMEDLMRQHIEVKNKLATENAELKQRCAKLKETLIHSNYPRCSSCGASTASDEPHAADCHVTAALAPDSGADCGTKEEQP